MRLVQAATVLLVATVAIAEQAFAASITAQTNACFFGCLYGYEVGDPAVSSTSRGATYDDPTSDWGYNLSSQASVVAWRNAFSIYFQANGSVSESNDVIAISAGGGVTYSDTLVFGGASGQGFVVFPWLVEGAVSVQGDPGEFPGAGAGASFVMGCSMVPAGSATGVVACRTDGVDLFESSTTYNEVWNLTVPITFGVSYVLNMTAGGGASIGAANGSASVIADFSHTGTLGAARVYDSFGNLVPNATITAESGLDYFDPQATPVPEPAAYSLLFGGLVALWLRSGVARCRSSR
jgi:hypothetical protein